MYWCNGKIIEENGPGRKRPFFIPVEAAEFESTTSSTRNKIVMPIESRLKKWLMNGVIWSEKQKGLNASLAKKRSMCRL
jgi:hypothetical protein